MNVEMPSLGHHTTFFEEYQSVSNRLKGEIMSLAAALKTRLNRYCGNEDGEVTVEWVVVTAMIIGMSVIVLSSIGNGTQVMADNVDTEMTDREVKTTY